MEAIRPTATGHQATGELIDDDHLPALHEVILVTLEKVLGPQSLFQVAHQTSLFRGDVLGPFRIAQWHVQQLFDVALTKFSQSNCAIALTDLVIFWIKAFDNLSHANVPLSIVVSWT